MLQQHNKIREIMDSIKFVGGATLQKELQGFAGFILAYQECLREGNSSTKGTNEKSMGEKFFRNPADPDSIGLVGEQLLYGIGVFSGLYTKENIENVTTTTRDNSASQPSTNQSCNPVSLVLKPSLHCLLSHEKRFIAGGGQSSTGITLSLILANGLKNCAGLLSNRMILCCAQEHIKNGKKALSIVMMHAEHPYRDHVSTGNLPSGMTLDDYYLFVCEGMYELLHPAVTASPST